VADRPIWGIGVDYEVVKDELSATPTAIFLFPVWAEVVSVTFYWRHCKSNEPRSLADRLRAVWKVGRPRIIVLPVSRSPTVDSDHAECGRVYYTTLS